MFLINDVKVLIISLLRAVLSPYAIDNIYLRTPSYAKSKYFALASACHSTLSKITKFW